MIELKRGDLFGTVNPMMVGKAINFIQKINSHDNKSFVSHSGIIDNADGLTMEALWSVSQQNLFDAYEGKRVLIARMDCPQVVKDGMLDRLKATHMGRIYPLWRLPLNIIPPMAKYISWKGKWLVCSELVAKFEFFCGMRHGQFLGATPDILADEWNAWKHFEIIFDDILDKNLFVVGNMPAA